MSSNTIKVGYQDVVSLFVTHAKQERGAKVSPEMGSSEGCNA